MESRRFGRDKSVGIPPRRGEEAGNLGLQPEGAPFFSLILALALALIVYGLFWGFSGDAIRRSNLSEIVFSNIKTSSSFTAWLTGTSELFKNAILLLKAFLGYGLLALFFFLGGLIWAKAPKKITAFLLSAFFLALVALFLTKYFNFELQFRCLPVIYLFTAGWSLKRKDALLFSLSIFSFLLSLRILFTCRAAHYGFYLLSPGIIIYYIFFLKIIPDFFQVEEIKKFFRLAYLFVFAWFALNHFLVSKFCYDHRSSKITTSRGELYVFDNQRERSCQELIEYLSSNTDQSDTLVVFPEGLTINFLSARDNPLYYYSFLPQDLAKIALSNELITELKDKQLTYIALVQRDTSEYGYPVFGRDYGRQVWDYIAKNFLLHKQFGPYPFSGGEFGVALFKNKLSYAQKQI
jgi:hypothetical protein